MSVDFRRFGRFCLAGAVAGLLIFIFFNPWLVRDEMRYSLRIGADLNIDSYMSKIKSMIQRLGKPDPLMAFIFTGTFAALVGGCLTFADQLGQSKTRIAVKVARALGYGMIIGGLSGVLADFIASRMGRGLADTLLNTKPENIDPGRVMFYAVMMMLGMTLGWILMGIGSGAAIGLTLGSKKRLIASLWGGFAGGIIGRIVFDAANGITSLILSSGSVGRFFGFIVMGAAIGAGVSVAEDIGKRFWVSVLTGAKEGRNFIISNPVTTIGRDELADIALFGDMSVAKLHASLRLKGYMVILQSEGGSPIAVNGTQVATVQLRDQDIINLGKHALRFHMKGAARRQLQQAYQPQPGYVSPQIVLSGNYQPNQTIALNTGAGCADGLVLSIIAGPHMNHSVRFGQGADIVIGREADCGLCLYNDHAISRRHAEIAWNGTSWAIRDLGSTNGLAVNGVNCPLHALAPGDQITIGTSVLRVDGV